MGRQPRMRASEIASSKTSFVPLFEICFWKGSVPVIDAVRFNAGKMLQTFLLGLLVMYVWMLMGIWWLSGEHQPETCNNMLDLLNFIKNYQS